jgi:hypothetical protein
MLDVTKEAHRQMLVDTFVNAVFVHDDKLLLTFNFKDGTRTITLNDVKATNSSSGSDLDCLAAPEKGYPGKGIPFLHLRAAGLERLKMRMSGGHPPADGSTAAAPRFPRSGQRHQKKALAKASAFFNEICLCKQVKYTCGV